MVIDDLIDDLDRNQEGDICLFDLGRVDESDLALGIKGIVLDRESGIDL